MKCIVCGKKVDRVSLTGACGICYSKYNKVTYKGEECKVIQKMDDSLYNDGQTNWYVLERPNGEWIEAHLEEI